MRVGGTWTEAGTAGKQIADHIWNTGNPGVSEVSGIIKHPDYWVDYAADYRADYINFRGYLSQIVDSRDP